ncbi:MULTISPECIES: GntP family permease [Claveliimonas]|uniref:Gluconate permease n=1 Tax=Claveliimonas bilis TaxID=3028070 RepID=A0ABM8ICP2_9FIRM|nr:GntP family permease [Claveliimonas bilis]MCQ5203326.1 GntP family permease [Mordavella massiliensis]BDZ78082.1 gluconate permease [Claveliimonas bilis]
MSEMAQVSLWLIISIVVILISIMKLKLSPVIGLIFGSLVMGLGCGMNLLDTATTIGTGFGDLMAGIGLPIGLGVILGKLLEENGGARVIAETLVAKAGEKYALYALGFAGFLLAIPVFFDITFIILVPLAIEVSKTLKKPLPYAIGAVTIGAAGAHTLVPPTPNPLAAAQIFHFDLGIMLGVGAVVCLFVYIIGTTIYFKMLDKGFWNKEKDETGILEMSESKPIPEGAPSFGMALIPLLLPVVCILLDTVSTAFGVDSAVLSFLADKTIAMLLGTLAAYLISIKSIGKNLESVANKAVADSGIVLLITGAGGSFGAVISATGFADIIAESFTSIGTSPVVLVLFAFIIAVVFRIALGSGTVASITSMNIMAGFASMTTLHPVFIALACLAGGISVGHVNDSGFWVVTNMSGYTVKGGLKSYTLAGIFIAVFTMIVCIAAALISSI